MSLGDTESVRGIKRVERSKRIHEQTSASSVVQFTLN